MVGWDPILFFFCAAEFLETVRALERYEWVGKMTPFLQEIRLLVEGRSLLNWIVNLHPGKLTWQWKTNVWRCISYHNRASEFPLPCLWPRWGFVIFWRFKESLNQIYHGFLGGAMFVQLRRWDVTFLSSLLNPHGSKTMIKSSQFLRNAWTSSKKDLLYGVKMLFRSFSEYSTRVLSDVGLRYLPFLHLDDGNRTPSFSVNMDHVIWTPWNLIDVGVFVFCWGGFLEHFYCSQMVVDLMEVIFSLDPNINN